VETPAMLDQIAADYVSFFAPNTRKRLLAGVRATVTSQISVSSERHFTKVTFETNVSVHIFLVKFQSSFCRVRHIALIARERPVTRAFIHQSSQGWWLS
jgi:hypothetical protein